MSSLKQFSKEDLLGVLERMMAIIPDPNFPKKVEKDLHYLKLGRLIKLHDKKVSIWKIRYERYVDKRIPKRLEAEYDAFIKSYQKTEKDAKAQEKLMQELGFLKEVKQ